MNDWEKDLKIYRLEQAPPKYENYQEYFEKYFAEHDETYLAWFLHYYEKELNTKARGFVNEYAMYGHFVDLKQAFVMGMMKRSNDTISPWVFRSLTTRSSMP